MLNEIIVEFIQEYGYFALCALFFLGIIGLPLAEETTMTFAGSLTGPLGPLSYGMTYISVYVGTMLGMMVSYGLGRKLGRPIIFRFGKWMKLTPKRILVAEAWFNRYGVWAVFFGYFVPGVRQFNCYFAGISHIPFYRYFIAASLGALVWCTTFLTLGHYIGRNFEQILSIIHHNLMYIIVLVIMAVVALIYGVYRFKTKKTSL